MITLAVIRLKPSLSDEKNEQLRGLIKSKINEYIARAEKLKEHLSSQEEKRSRAAIGANGKESSGAGSGGKK